jgi:hypothetical protein
MLLAIVWLDWHKQGRDILVVFSSRSKESLEEIASLLVDSGTLLDWADRRNWPRWPAGSQLFRLYASL